LNSRDPDTSETGDFRSGRAHIFSQDPDTHGTGTQFLELSAEGYQVVGFGVDTAAGRTGDQHNVRSVGHGLYQGLRL
jgi:hypothetical protein